MHYKNKTSYEDLTESVSSPITTLKNADGMWSLSRSWSREAFLIITSFFARRVCHSPELCLVVGWGEETWGKCQIKQLRSHDSPPPRQITSAARPRSSQSWRAGTLTLELCSLRTETVSDTLVWNSFVVCRLQRMNEPEWGSLYICYAIYIFYRTYNRFDGFHGDGFNCIRSTELSWTLDLLTLCSHISFDNLKLPKQPVKQF